MIRRRSVFLILSVFGLASCSSMDLAVRFADTYVMWETDHYLDLTSLQEKTVRPEVEQALKDVRGRLFPQIADFLDSIATDLRQHEITDESMNAWYEGTRKFYLTGVALFEPFVQDLVKSATTAQLERFTKQSTEKLNELRAKTGTPEKAFKVDEEKFEKWSDFISLRLDRAQQKEIDQYLHEHPTPFATQIAERERLLKEFMALPATERPQWIHRLTADPESLRTPEAKAVYRAADQAAKDLSVKLWKSLSKEQKDEVLQGLQKKAAEFRRLAKVSH